MHCLKGLVERFIVAISDADGKALDHVSVKCQMRDSSLAVTNATQCSEQDYSTMEEELRSVLLRLSLLDAQMQKPPAGRL